MSASEYLLVYIGGKYQTGPPLNAVATAAAAAAASFTRMYLVACFLFCTRFFFDPCLFSFLKERERFPQYEYAL